MYAQYYPLHYDFINSLKTPFTGSMAYLLRNASQPTSQLLIPEMWLLLFLLPASLLLLFPSFLSSSLPPFLSSFRKKITNFFFSEKLLKPKSFLRKVTKLSFRTINFGKYLGFQDLFYTLDTEDM